MMMAAGPLMLALIVAFAADPVGVRTAPRPGDLAGYVLQAIIALAISACVQMAIGLGLSIAIRRRGQPTSSSRQLVHVAAFLIQAMNLAVYTWLIHGLGWPIVVRTEMGLRGSLVLDELVILLPYLV